MTVRHALFAALATLAVTSAAFALPPSHTSATVGDVTLDGVANRSSTQIRHDPEVTLTNAGAASHVVELVSLTSLGDGGSAPLEVDRPTRQTLAPHAQLTWSVVFRGVPIESGVGLPYRRFQVSFTVDGRPASVVASNAYMCRIPVRH